MQITYSRAFWLFGEARKWFAEGEKGAGKTYPTTSQLQDRAARGFPMPSAALQQKFARRNQNSDVAGEKIKRLRASRPNESFIDYGKHIHQSNIRYGDCWEMTAFAAYLVYTHHPGVGLYVIEIDEPVKHAFLAVNNTNNLKDCGCVQDLLYIQGLIVIDVWLGVCCPSANYPRESLSKLTIYDGQGKLIHGDPALEYAPFFLRRSRISVSDASSK